MTPPSQYPASTPNADVPNSVDHPLDCSDSVRTEEEDEEAFQQLLDEMDEELRLMSLELRRVQELSRRGPWWLLGFHTSIY